MYVLAIGQRIGQCIGQCILLIVLFMCFCMIIYDLKVTSSNYTGRFSIKYIGNAESNCLWNDLYMKIEIFNLGCRVCNVLKRAQ